jgi:hypothetical protein
MKPWLKATLVILCIFAGWVVLSIATYDDDTVIARKMMSR